jgi:hypothetical protein
MGFYQLVPTWDEKLIVSLHCRDPKEYFHLRAWLRCASFRMQCQMTQDAQKASALPEKEVIQPHLPVRLPCYDFTPVTSIAFDIPLLAIKVTTWGMASSHSVTGGVYKARERIHRRMVDRRLLAIMSSCRRVAALLMGKIDHPSTGRVELVRGCLNNPSRLEWTTLTSLMAPLAALRSRMETKEK